MQQNMTFTSISSDNVLFDFDSIIRRVKKQAGITEEQVMIKCREYFQKQYPHASPEERMFMVAGYLTSAMSYDKFVVTLDMLGANLNLNITM